MYTLQSHMMWSSPVTVLCVVKLLHHASSSPVHPRHHHQSFPNTEQWPVATVGKALEPQLPDEELQDILSQVSQVNIEATIRKLASFGTRHTLSSQTDPDRGIGAARAWLTEKFQEAADASEGRMTVDWNSFIKQPGDNERIIFPVNITSVVATLRGSEEPDRLYLTGGHYDSRNSDPIDYEGDAPGAVDEYDPRQKFRLSSLMFSQQCLWCSSLTRARSNLCQLQAQNHNCLHRVRR